jgi:type I restriction enzyme M protein
MPKTCLPDKQAGGNRKTYSDDDFEVLLHHLGADTPRLKPEHLIFTLFSRQNESDFAKLFDDTLLDLAQKNN